MIESTGVSIRAANSGDREQWRELFLAYGVFYATDFSEDILHGVWAWIEDPEHPLRAWVAHTEDTLLGFAHVREHPDTFRAGPSWFLDDLFTSPKARGKGVATALIEHARVFALHNGGGDLRWITGQDNLTAQRLYDAVATKTPWVMYEISPSSEEA